MFSVNLKNNNVSNKYNSNKYKRNAQVKEDRL